MSPTISRGKSGRSYRYYVSAPLQQGVQAPHPDRVRRVSAIEIERVVADAVRRWIHKIGDPLEPIRSVRLNERGLHVTVSGTEAASITSNLAEDETILDRTADTVTVLLPILFASRGSKQKIVPSAPRPPQPDPVLIAALRMSYSILRTERGMLVLLTAPDSPYDRNILRLAFLAPDIQRAILDGRQPIQLNLEALKKTAIPLAWSEQRKVLGFGKTGAPCSAD